MRKLTFITALFAFTLSCSQKDNVKKSDWFHEGLKGNVKTIEESYFGAFGTSEKVEKGDFSVKITISYDQNGYRIDDKSKVKSHYNTAGLKDTITNLATDGVMESKFVNVFNEAGDLSQTRMFDMNGNPVYAWLYEYDSNKRQITETLYDGVGSQLSRNRFLYEDDAKGNWIKKIVVSVETDEPLQVIERTITYY